MGCVRARRYRGGGANKNERTVQVTITPEAAGHSGSSILDEKRQKGQL